MLTSKGEGGDIYICQETFVGVGDYVADWGPNPVETGDNALSPIYFPCLRLVMLWSQKNLVRRSIQPSLLCSWPSARQGEGSPASVRSLRSVRPCLCQRRNLTWA